MNISNSIADITPIIRGLIKDQALKDGRDITSFDTDNKFTLSESFVNEQSIKCFKNGEEINSSNFSYNPDNNQVTIDFVSSGDDLVKDDIVMITYEYFKKFSDEEIAGYIKSALSYFSMYNHPKTFDIVDNEIISINNTDATIQELYFIAIISSILIDPQNINIEITGSLKISASRNKSDQDQIREAFAQYNRFIGTIDFTIFDKRLI